MSYVWTVGLLLGAFFIISQRIVQRHRRMFRGFIVFMVILLFIWGNRLQETAAGLAIGLTASYLFWLLIGRYNPVGNPDEDNIKVYGLDD